GGGRGGPGSTRSTETAPDSAPPRGISCGGRHRKEQPCDRALVPAPILQRQAPAVGLRDLAAQNEADPRATGLRREERDEEVGGLGQTRSVVGDPDLEALAAALPSDGHAAARLER